MEALFNFDFAIVFSWQSLLAILGGTLLGLLVGAIPGLGSTVGVAMILPATLVLEPLHGVLLLVALYQASEYGNSITAIVLGIPGSGSAVPTVLDGSPMAKAGYPGKALGYSLYPSFVGGLVGAFVVLFFSQPLSVFAINFSDPEIFLVCLLGLISVVTLASKDIPKSVVSVMIGLLLSSIGTDVFTGVRRFTVGSLTLVDGVSIVALIIGLFAFTEILAMTQGDLGRRQVTDPRNTKVNLTWSEFKGVRTTTIKGSFIGVAAGVIPGLGPTVGSWLSYTEAKRSSKHPETFGHGEPNGIAAADSANNGVVGGALLPMLTLGIPGSATVAIILAGLIIQGIRPGPRIFLEQTSLVHGILWGFLLATIFMFVLGKYTTQMWARMLTIPNFALTPVILVASLIGAYAHRSGNMFDVGMAFVVGLVGYFIWKLDYSFAALILAFVLGDIVEDSLRRSLMLSRGSYEIFFTRTYSQLILVLIALLIGASVYRSVKQHRSKRETTTSGTRTEEG